MSIARVLLSVVCLIGLGLWAEYSKPFVDPRDLLDAPQAFDGMEVEGFSGWRATHQSDDGFVLERDGRRIVVIAEVGDEPLGRNGMLRGVFRAPDKIEAIAWRYPSNSERNLKIAVSLLSVVLLPLLVFLAVGIDADNRALVLKRRDHA